MRPRRNSRQWRDELQQISCGECVMVGVRCDNALAHKTSTPVGSLASGLTIANPGPRRAYVAALANSPLHPHPRPRPYSPIHLHCRSVRNRLLRQACSAALTTLPVCERRLRMASLDRGHQGPRYSRLKPRPCRRTQRKIH